MARFPSRSSAPPAPETHETYGAAPQHEPMTVPAHPQEAAMASSRAPDGLFLAASKRFWWLITVLAVVCAAIGVFAGTTRNPVYTASSQLNVGTLNAQLQAVPGYVEAAKSLASSYSRLASTNAVLDPVARKLGTSTADVRARMTVTPITENPIINVLGEGPSEADARALDDALATELIAQVRSLDTTSRRTARLLARYRAASQRASRYEEELRTLRARRDADAASVSVDRIERAQSRAETERLQTEALGSQYQTAASKDPSASGIERFGQPTMADDRTKKIQQFALVGLIAGGALGLAGAVLLTARRRRTAF